MTTKPKRDAVVTVQFTPTEKEILFEVAERQGISASALLRTITLKYLGTQTLPPEQNPLHPDHFRR